MTTTKPPPKGKLLAFSVRRMQPQTQLPLPMAHRKRDYWLPVVVAGAFVLGATLGAALALFYLGVLP